MSGNREYKLHGNKSFNPGRLQRDRKTPQREVSQIANEGIPFHVVGALYHEKKIPGIPNSFHSESKQSRDKEERQVPRAVRGVMAGDMNK